MFANLVHVRLDADVETARKGLRDDVLPRIKRQHGLVAGYWLQPANREGFSVTIWETLEAAQEAAALVPSGSHPTPSVTVERVDIRQVVESL
jgi:hypothetical protein